MLRFLSRRKARNVTPPETEAAASSQIKPKRIETNKNIIQCRIVLLDGTDLSVDLTVSEHTLSKNYLKYKTMSYMCGIH